MFLESISLSISACCWLFILINHLVSDVFVIILTVEAGKVHRALLKSVASLDCIYPKRTPEPTVNGRKMNLYVIISTVIIHSIL